MASTSTRRTVRAAGAGALAIAATAALGLPALAADDSTVVKTASVSSASAGDAVTYTVEVRGSSLVDFSDLLNNSDLDVTIQDTLPAHMTYVPGSATVVFNDASLFTASDGITAAGNYSTGSGWNGSWVEANDDGAAATGDIRASNTILGPRLWLRDTGADLPSLTREVALPGTVRSVLVTFGALPVNLQASDTMQVQLSFDGGATWPVTQSYAGNALPLIGAVSAEGISASTLHVRFVVTGGTYGSSILGLDRFSLNNILVTYVADSGSTTWNDAGDPSSGLTDSAWDVTYGDTLILTYQAQIDSVIADETVADPTVPTVTTSLTNTATVTSSDDGGSLQGDVTIDLIRNPDFDIDVTSNGPVSVGQPLTLTAVVSHSDASDGFPLCDASFQANVPDYEFTLASGDDGDGCLEYSEEWTFVHVIPGVTGTSGVHGLQLGLFGAGQVEQFEDVLAYEYTVVLADSGARDVTGALVTAAGLVGAGAAMIVVSRRRRLG
jgi:uncharacterized repeat protein (TIGR01451 family)